jgi:hypothetical protein
MPEFKTGWDRGECEKLLLVAPRVAPTLALPGPNSGIGRAAEAVADLLGIGTDPEKAQQRDKGNQAEICRHVFTVPPIPFARWLSL